MDAEPGSPEGRELDVLVDLVGLYERRHEPMGYPDPVAAIEFRMDQAGLSPRDLIPFIGTRTKVSEVLSGKRAITRPMARVLHEHLGIPADVLLRPPARPPDQRSASTAPPSGAVLHELAHVGRHMDHDDGHAFVDDLLTASL